MSDIDSMDLTLHCLRSARRRLSAVADASASEVHGLQDMVLANDIEGLDIAHDMLTALAAENADLIRRVREAEARANDTHGDRRQWLLGYVAFEALFQCTFGLEGNVPPVIADEHLSRLVAERDALASRVREADREREDYARERYEDRKADQRREHAVSAEFARLHAERDTIRAELDSARVDGRMMEEAARRLGVDVDGLKPAHVFRAIDKAIAERDAARGGRETWFELATKAEAERDAALAALEAMRVERDARVAITPGDALAYIRYRAAAAIGVADEHGDEPGFTRVNGALREHGKGGK